MKNEGLNFIAALDGVELSDEQIEKINSGIQQVVMGELAKIDKKGDLIITGRIVKNPKFGDFPIHTRGIWIEDFDLFRNRAINDYKNIKR
ncbi:hypothetical protein [Marinigracilibium pacificum]|uniref:Uncharacterized protein n=1 Tax=Marinigracilibium pacificum TaxID=2729599 RepID=A0A848J2U4_9BACT|nr:hypothetical protein [Marinigracilibium pacificum]NMM49825.1 hypothetical protein [Marinigracilibium pacificum]